MMSSHFGTDGDAWLLDNPHEVERYRVEENLLATLCLHVNGTKYYYHIYIIVFFDTRDQNLSPPRQFTGFILLIFIATSIG
jgi:hypothetical protein